MQDYDVINYGIIVVSLTVYKNDDHKLVLLQLRAPLVKVILYGSYTIVL